jgi:threonine synthase
VKPYYYHCFNCHTQFSASEIEQDRHYLCPKCGKPEKNKPLHGALLISFDYQQLKKRYNRPFFLKQPAGQIWRYPLLWPLQPPEYAKDPPFQKIEWKELFSVDLPATKIHEIRVDTHTVKLLDETNNPTYSYKDRASTLVALKARQLGLTAVSTASTGNAASSMAGICARFGLEAHLWVPENIPEAKLMQILAYGGQVHLVRGDYDTAFDLSLEISQRMGWYNRNTAYNPLTMEGKKSGAFDIFIGLRGDLPDYIFVPVGDGVVIGGIYKGFCELQHLGVIEDYPKLIAVQSSGSNALIRFMQTGKFEYLPAETIADSISAGAPRNLYFAANSVRESGGFALEVDDADIVKSQKLINERTGILVEPAGAASLAGYIKAKSEGKIDPDKKSMILLTGSGLKDIDSLKRLHRRPDAFRAEVWQERYVGE